MKTLFFAFLFLVGVGFVGCNRNKEKIVAEVNGENVTADEFRDRFQSYMSQGGQRDNIILRQKILDNMINERLIFADCTRQGFDSDASYRQKYEEIESQAMLDTYAKRISTDTIQVSEQELYKEFKAYNTKVKTRYLYAETEEAAQQLRDALMHGATFDSLAKDVFEDPGLANNGGNIGYFAWGDMEPAYEEAAYSLPIGQISEPVRLKVGFGIIQVLDKVSNPLPSELDYAKAKDKLERAIIQKKTLRLITEAGHGVARNLDAHFNEKAVSLIFKNWQFIADESRTMEQQPSFQDALKDMALVQFKDKSWTVQDFLARAAKTTKGQRRRVKDETSLKNFTKGLAVREVLLEKARSENLADEKETKSQIKKMRDMYLLKRWMFLAQDTVGQHGWDEAAMRGQYQKSKKEFASPPEVKVAEILVRTQSEAEAVLKELKRGADFAALAQKFSLRRSTARRGGELGWGTKSAFGNLGEKFLAAKPGALIGPEFVDPYFGVFKILGKQEGKAKTFEESRGQISAMLASAKKLQIFEEAVSVLRSRAAMTLHNDELANIVIN